MISSRCSCWIVKSDGCSIKELEKRKRKLKQANRERELKKRRIMKDKLHAFKMLHRGRFSSISMPLHEL